MTRPEGRSLRHWTGTPVVRRSSRHARAMTPAPLLTWHGDRMRPAAGRIHGIVLALGVLAVFAAPATSSAGASTNSGRPTPVSLAPTVSTGSGPTGLAYDARTDTLYSANQNSNSLSVVATKSCNASDTKGCAQHVGTVAVGSGALPQGVALDAATDTLYVANAGTDTISVLNTKTCNAGDLSGCSPRNQPSQTRRGQGRASL